MDLPGYGYARVSKTERRRLSGLIEHYLGDRQPLVGVVWLLDIRRDPSTADETMGATLTNHGLPVLIALTKADKLSRKQQADRTTAIAGALDMPPDQIIATSSLKKLGIDDLRRSIGALLES